MRVMDSFKKNGIIFFIFLLFFFFGIGAAKAQQSVSPHLTVFPEKFELEVQRNQHLENKIIIFNKSEVALPIEAKVLNFTAEENTGTIQFYSGSTGEQGIDDTSFNPRKWIKIENPNFILDSNEKNEINFSIDVPQNAEPGGHYAVILFEPKLPSFYFQEGQPKVIPVIGVLFLLSVKVEGLSWSGDPLTIIDFSIPEKLRLEKLENLFGFFSEAQAAEKKTAITETSYLPFSLKIKNNDIFHIKPSGSLSILSSRGKLIGQSEIQKTTILPGRTRAFPVDFKPSLPEKIEKYLPDFLSQLISKNLLFGKYQANLSLISKDNIIEENIAFWVFPWKVFLSTVFIAFFFLFIMIKYRKRFLGAMLVLLKNKNE